MDHARFSLEVPLCFLPYFWPHPPHARSRPNDMCQRPPEAALPDELRTIANWYGLSDNTLVDTWLADGFSTDEIEKDFLYDCGSQSTA